MHRRRDLPSGGEIGNLGKPTASSETGQPVEYCFRDATSKDSRTDPGRRTHPNAARTATHPFRPFHRLTLPRFGDVMRLHPPLTGRRTTHLWAAVVALAAASPLWSGTPNTTPGLNPRVTPIVEVARKARFAVVNIHSEKTLPGATDPFNPIPTNNRVNGMGTGIVIDPRGYIVTNHHVVEDVQVLRVKLADGTTHSARVIARDSENDLAVLKIDTSHPLTTVPLGTASDLMVGEPVVAIGNAFGYEHTHTTGIVSHVKRDVALNKDVSYKGLIQTDASINPGNSGGPLLNIYGELIGVNVAIRAGAQNIGFAIPVDNMVHVVADLLSLRRRTGIGHGIATHDTIDVTNNPITRTCIADRVEAGSLAEKAGVKAGDRIIRVGSVEVGCSLDLERGFLEKLAGEKVSIVVRRGGDESTVELTVPSPSAQVVVSSSSPAATTDMVWKKLGIRVAAGELTQIQKANPQLRGGVVIQEIDSDGTAAKAGMQRGDILIGLHQFETLSVDNITWVLSHPDLASFTPLKFFLIRSSQVRRGLLSHLPD